LNNVISTDRDSIARGFRPRSLLGHRSDLRFEIMRLSGVRRFRQIRVVSEHRHLNRFIGPNSGFAKRSNDDPTGDSFRESVPAAASIASRPWDPALAALCDRKALGCYALTLATFIQPRGLIIH